jgi:signal transduction histidine kinase
LRGEDVEHYETVRRHKSGTHIDVLLTISPIRDARGEIMGISKIARNITQRKVWEKELAESLAREQAANRAKDGFLAMLSHELRTPLSPVLLLASDLERDIDLPPRARAGFNAIRKNIELQARLIDDLLDMNRIVHGKLTLEKSETDVEEILKDAISTVESELKQKNITLRVEFQAKSHKVIGDAVRLRQVFWNIMKNAVKFSRKDGVITICSELVAGDRLQVTITDTGIGMEADEVERLFDPFSQGRHALGGMGLGLAISRGLVEFHGGSIHASSPGKGKVSTISIKLPALKSRSETNEAISHPSAVSPAIPPSKKASTRILLVEDHESTIRALTQLLVRRRYKVTNAGSYAEACSIMESGDRFDVLISDIGLPDGNGYDLMVQFKQKFCGKGIALTGYGMEQDVSRSREAGFTTHLTKPVRMEALEAALAIMLNVS